MTCKERILSNDYSDIILDFHIPEDVADDPNLDFCYHNIDRVLGILYIERSGVTEINVSSGSYPFLPKCYGLMQTDAGLRRGGAEFNTLSLTDAGILSAQGNPLNLTGRDVMIGFIDTGIQYENEVFRDAAGRTRIKAIWDQTIQTGEPPADFDYGTEYTQEMIQRALESENPRSIVPSTDTLGHGTEMASVAAGSRLSGQTRFIGAAPECDIVVVKLKEAKQYLKDYYLIPDGVPCYQETDILQAIQYLQTFSASFTRPLVVCMGIGTSLGDHAGTSALGRYMELVSRRKGRAFVAPAGNEGNSGHHFQGELTPERPYRDVEIRVGADTGGFVMDLWGSVPHLFSATVRSPGGESIQWINPRIKKPQEFSFVFERTRLTVEYLLVEQASGSELIRFRFEAPTQGIWTVRVSTEGTPMNSRFNIWLPITQFLSDETYFLESNPYITLTEPSYVHCAICTTAYNDANGSIYSSAGRGYARDDYVKPDIAAPGVDVSTILGPRTGSSIAAAITAGGVAQILQWAVIEDNDIMVASGSVKNYLIMGAQRESNLSYPNREWGYGKLDVEGVFRFLAGV
ncbi:MAG: S8 family peptidase [Roseburia sp.]|nr:S8 family peptidase [Roseburia sp.]